MIDLTEFDIDLSYFYRVMKKYLQPHLMLWAALEHGPAGFKSAILTKALGRPVGSIVVSQAEFDGAEWIHASIAWNDHLPNYEDLVALKRAAFGDEKEVYMVFPKASNHVNIHEYALHLYGRVDGVPVLPDFTDGGGTI